MEQSMREQLKALVDRWHERGIPSILWVLAELKRILAEAPPCTCPTLDGIKIVGSSCPVHGFPSCELASPTAVSVKAQWVPVTERMPGVLLDVFTWDGNAYHIAYRREGAWIRSDGFFLRNVTHWHAINYPQPPEVKL